MGLDIAATRVTRIINQYIEEYCDYYTPKTIWITGHSRGGGIANIVGVNLTDRQYETFVYTFAAPNTTTAPTSMTYKYRSIFNIVNLDDLVPALPLTNWVFRKYGITKSLSVGEKYKYDWSNLTNQSYISNRNAKDNLLGEFSTLADSREGCYRYTCDCHGNGSNNDIIITSFQSKGGNPRVIDYGKKYCKTMYREDSIVVEFKMCQTTAYFMQYLAKLSANSGTLGGALNIIVFTPVASLYENIKKDFISFGMKNMHDPHLPISYYLLARKI